MGGSSHSSHADCMLAALCHTERASLALGPCCSPFTFATAHCGALSLCHCCPGAQPLPPMGAPICCLCCWSLCCSPLRRRPDQPRAPFSHTAGVATCRTILEAWLAMTVSMLLTPLSLAALPTWGLLAKDGCCLLGHGVQSQGHRGPHAWVEQATHITKSHGLLWNPSHCCPDTPAGALSGGCSFGCD